MTNNNHYDQGGPGPLVNPGSERRKKAYQFPQDFRHIVSKKGNIVRSQIVGPPGENVNTKNNHRLNANDFWYDLWVINLFISSVSPYS